MHASASDIGSALTRRDLLRTGLSAGAALALSSLDPGLVLDRALAGPPRCGQLTDIEHVVILVQENRSFDSYFGGYRGVLGFGDPRPLPLPGPGGQNVFAQPGYPAPGFGGHLYPFHLDTAKNGECVNDITHDWGPQHRSWNAGAMDGFVRQHVQGEGADHGAVTMGYYRRSDLPFYYALADAFTVCDHYHCSVLGPTDPNQLYLVSGTLDPAGQHGGPLVETLGTNRPVATGILSWTTMPEQLQARGVSWKVYSGDNTTPTEDSPFPLFRQYHERPELTASGLLPTFPGDFQADAARGVLPQVSWVYAAITQSEHPPAPVTYGEHTAALVLDALVGNRALWAKTALFITWDENGGFFDHVAPPVPPDAELGEFITARPLPSAADEIAGPIGLGFRVPLLVVSPFSRGGLVCSDTFDHTSLLRFLERRFGAEVPNLSAWRRASTGDLVSAFNFAAGADATAPSLPAPSPADPRVTTSNCPAAPATLAPGAGSQVPAYPVPPNSMPSQEPGARGRPSGPCGPRAPSPSGPGRSPASLRIRVLVSRRCHRGGVRVVVAVDHSAALQWVRVHLGRRRLTVTTRTRFTLVAHPRGRHPRARQLVVTAVDRAGARARASVRLPRCGA
jgi:phospholipase C